MRIIFAFISLLTVIGCSQTISQQDLHYLNGYWEITEVKLSDGTKKEYKVNATVDYIELKGVKGLRKKVRPKFDGTFIASQDHENFTLVKKGERYEMYYKNGMNDWTEKLTALTEDFFTVSDKDNISYTYRRFHNINAKDNGETKK